VGNDETPTEEVGEQKGAPLWEVKFTRRVRTATEFDLPDFGPSPRDTPQTWTNIPPEEEV